MADPNRSPRRVANAGYDTPPAAFARPRPARPCDQEVRRADRTSRAYLVAVTTTSGTLDELIAAVAAGHTIKYLYFWGHRPQRDGSIGSGCLSQWWPAEFTVDGRRFPTAEHYMMWRKATLFDDHETAEQILNAPHPHQECEWRVRCRSEGRLSRWRTRLGHRFSSPCLRRLPARGRHGSRRVRSPGSSWRGWPFVSLR